MRIHDNCPTPVMGQIADLEKAPFEFHVHLTNATVEIFGVFGGVDEDGDPTGLGEPTELVETGLVTAHASSPIVRKVAQLIGLSDIRLQASDTILNSDKAFVEQLRTRFCERVAECPGVVNGECWALGDSALRESIEQISLEA